MDSSAVPAKIEYCMKIFRNSSCKVILLSLFISKIAVYTCQTSFSSHGQHKVRLHRDS